MRGGVGVLLVGLLVTGCGAAPPRIGPTGVDGLTIPTPSPDPADFVEVIDNELLPLLPGSSWTYRATTEDGFETITATVTSGTSDVAGVATTDVHEVSRDEDGTALEDSHHWFAQDTAGNVWYFGKVTTAHAGGAPDAGGSWQAGRDGAEAGLVMPAAPRVGDGFQQSFHEGEAEDRARVLDVDAALSIRYGDLDGLLETEDTTPLEPGLVTHAYYAPGIGLVYEETVEGGDATVELVSFTAP